MKTQSHTSAPLIVVVTILLSFAGNSAYAANAIPVTPEMAAKRENYRKQNEQRITPEKRKAAAEALKAERLKVYQAKQLVNKSNQVTTGNSSDKAHSKHKDEEKRNKH